MFHWYVLTCSMVHADAFHVSVCVDLFYDLVMCVDLFHVSVMPVDWCSMFQGCGWTCSIFQWCLLTCACFSDAGGPVLWDDRPTDSGAVHLHHCPGALQVVIQDTGHVPSCPPHHLWLEEHTHSAPQPGLEAGWHLPWHPYSLTGQCSFMLTQHLSARHAPWHPHSLTGQ